MAADQPSRASQEPTTLPSGSRRLCEAGNTAQRSLDQSQSTQGQDGKDSKSEDGSWSKYEYPPLKLDYEALRHVATYYLPGDHGRCTEIVKLTRGTFHEVELLHFEDGWTCIGRFVRSTQTLAQAESEVATMEYVKKHTTISVPTVYFVNHNPNHVVGASFMLMERLPGDNLCKMWSALTLEHKKAAISQLADVLTQLASLEFDVIGSLTATGIGPAQEQYIGEDNEGMGPFDTFKGYLHGLMDASESLTCCEECARLCAEIKAELDCFFEENDELDPIFDPPFRLYHADLDSQNLLFYPADGDEPPKLTGVIDWDGATTQPLYFAYDYPNFLKDTHYESGKYQENKTLRQHLVHEVANRYPEGSQQRQDARAAFYQKQYFIHNWNRCFPYAFDEHEHQASALKWFLPKYFDGTGTPYNGRLDWEADTDSECEESDDEGNGTDSGNQSDDEMSDDGESRADPQGSDEEGTNGAE